MDKINAWILQKDFRNFWKRFFLISLVIVILGGAVTGLSFRTQISEVFSSLQQREEGDDRLEADIDRRERELPARVPITEPPLSAKIVLCAYGCLCLLLFSVYWLTMAAWLYQAAVLSGMNGLLWLAAGLFGNLFAAFLFLLTRSMIRKKCPNCRRYQQVKAIYCASCGTPLYEKCPSCGELCRRGGSYCPACGSPLSGASSSCGA